MSQRREKGDIGFCPNCTSPGVAIIAGGDHSGEVMAEPHARSGDDRGEHAAERLREFLEKRYPQGLEPSEEPREPEDDTDRTSSERRSANHDPAHHAPDEEPPTDVQ